MIRNEKEEMKEILGMKATIYSYANGDIIGKYYRIEKNHDIGWCDVP